MTAGPSVSQVDDAVRGVLGDLLRAGRVRGDGLPGRSEEVFAGRLLSARLAESLAGRSCVKVSTGTVVTPLARDVLKRLGVEVRFLSCAETSLAVSRGEWGFAIETRANSGVVDAFRKGLLGDPAGWSEIPDSLEVVAGWVTVGEGRGALLLTDEPAVAVFRACRFPGVRAASADDPSAVSRAVRTLGANLIAIEPAGMPLALLRQAAATFRGGGGPIPPDWCASDFCGGLMR